MCQYPRSSGSSELRQSWARVGSEVMGLEYNTLVRMYVSRYVCHPTCSNLHQIWQVDRPADGTSTVYGKSFGKLSSFNTINETKITFFDFLPYFLDCEKTIDRFKKLHVPLHSPFADVHICQIWSRSEHV